ncbi:MAG: serine/threonine-protein kinase [Ruminococcus sp.]|nr:serine/threonine-protein kinase [Ruminococcus sp.]
MSKLCYNCMKPLDENGACPYCRCPEQGARAPYHLAPGTLIDGRYIIGRSLGEGGFGITYIGFDSRLNRRVAVKEYYPSGVANRQNGGNSSIIITQGKEGFFDRGKNNFLDEARSVARFTNEEGIVDVYDFFEENKTAYIIMEYIEGINLKQHIRRNGTIQPAALIEMMLPVMRSLSNMHSAGIIHRDISPDNIMYTTSRKLKLTDFGSARYFANEERELSVVLKHGYAPVEQYTSTGRQGPYTDVYAMCATIYNCITGRPPVDSLDRQIQDTLIPPSQLGVPISPVQESALMHGLAVRYENRCPNMQTLISEITGRTPYINQFYGAGNMTRTMSAEDNFINNNYHQNGGYQNTGYYNGQPPQKQSNTPITVAIVISSVAVAVMLTIVFFLLFSSNNSSEPAAETTAAEVTTDDSSGNGISPVTTEKPTEASKTETPTPPEKEREESSKAESSEVQSSTSKYPDLGLSHSEVDSICKDIGKQWRSTSELNQADEKKSGCYDVSRYQFYGNYAKFRATDGSYRINTPGDRWDDGRSDRTVYYYTSDGVLYFAFSIMDDHEYRYYIYNNQIIKYTYAEGKGASQKKYYCGDSVISDDMNDDLLGGAQAAKAACSE